MGAPSGVGDGAADGDDREGGHSLLAERPVQVKEVWGCEQ